MMPLIHKKTNAHLRTQDEVMTNSKDEPSAFKNIDKDGGAHCAFG
jgi:hypothetical protein